MGSKGSIANSVSRPSSRPLGRASFWRRISNDYRNTWVRQAAKGAGTSGLNPKVFLLFLALLPAFVDPGGAWPVGLQMLVLGLVHVANCAVVYLVVGAGARIVLRAHPAGMLFLLFAGKSRREEAWLAAIHPGYGAYQRRTKRLIPWIY